MKYTVCILIVLSLFSCRDEDFYGSENVKNNVVASKEIDASCSVAQVNPGSGSVSMPTRGIIGQSTVAQMDANFIKLDEERQTLTSPEEYRPTPFLGWDYDRTRIVNAYIFSSPDNTENVAFRSVSFTPTLTYQMEEIKQEDDPTAQPEIVGYISRMVGWYPKTFDVPVGDNGVGLDMVINNASSSFKKIEKNGTTYDCVVFKNKLDGKTDVMMTDMREGRYDLSSKGFKNNDSDYDVQPYGHIFNNLVDASGGYGYCNYFSFNHYLTAVRLYVSVDKSDLSLVSWKSINDVVFMDQPQTVAIALPTSQNRDETGSGTPLVPETTPTLPSESVTPVFGEALEWSDWTNMPIIREAMAEDDPEHPEFADTPVYPIELENTVSLEKTYLGYILLEPGKDAEFEIHTDAGVFKAKIPHAITSSSEGTMVQKKILEPGNIYNIVVDMQADGSLDIIVGNEDFESFRNLTPYNNEIKDFEYSNCFIINQDMMIKTKDDNGVVTEWYDGFYFQAIVPGRGEKGFITDTGADLYPKDLYFSPHSVKILWQDEPYLVTFVELVHGYIRFSLYKDCRNETTPLQGNAVIAALDENDNIIWSWHIWVVNSVEDIGYDVDGSSIKVMNMNLGATKASWTGESDILNTYGFYYQWGRKDPSPLPPSYNYSQNDMRTSEYYYMDEGERDRVYRFLDLRPTVEMGAKHPLDIIATSQVSLSYPNDWLYSSIDRLWGYNPLTGKVEGKTIYDPCPYGYKVPVDELYKIFNDAWNTNIGGWWNPKYNWHEESGKGIILTNGDESNYFPFSGWRGHDRGRTDKTNAWYEVGNLGDYQDARISTTDVYSRHRGRTLIIKKDLLPYYVRDVGTYYNNITLDYANRASASPVRCVRYDGEPADGTISNP